MAEYDREGVADDLIGQQTMGEEPGLAGGEFPGAEDEVEDMSEHLEAPGQATTFGGRYGSLGPEGTIGTIEEGNAVGGEEEA